MFIDTILVHYKMQPTFRLSKSDSNNAAENQHLDLN